MNVFKLSWKYIIAKPLNTLLNVVLLGLGIAIIVVLLLFSHQFGQKVTDNAKGIDLVVGAKGSPMQLILCNIYHVDFPTGNILLSEAEKLKKNRYVKTAVPLSLGDNYKRYRIVGTTTQYFDLYGLSLAQGVAWADHEEVVVGANVAKTLGLALGDEFSSQHGFDAVGESHHHHPLHVVGILQPTGMAVDNLILTSLETVWEAHHISATDSTREITSLLIQYRSPMGVVQVPRYINGKTNMQAASPAFETARIFSIMGTGADVIRWFAAIIIFIAALSIFIALYNSLRQRSYDLAMMRAMGASKSKLFVSIILEGMLITVMGALAGYVLGHATMEALGTYIPEAAASGLTGFLWLEEEWYIFGGGLFLGIVASLIPAISVLRADISKVLAKA